VPVDTFFLVKSFVTLIVVIDPVSSVPLFLAMTDRYQPRQRHRAAWQAILVAALIIGGLRPVRPADPAVLGDQAPELKGRRRSAAASGRPRPASWRGRGPFRREPGQHRLGVGTRLLAGPWAIAAIKVFMREASTAPERVGVALGLGSVLIVLWLTLRFAGWSSG
jgi:multiple antibiotic resistance protein